MKTKWYRGKESKGSFLAAARSRCGSDMPPACHSLPQRRFATPRAPPRLYCRRLKHSFLTVSYPSFIREAVKKEDRFRSMESFFQELILSKLDYDVHLTHQQFGAVFNSADLTNKLNVPHIDWQRSHIEICKGMFAQQSCEAK